MRKTLLFGFLALFMVFSGYAQHKIAHTVHLMFDSRIYLLDTEGNTITYFEYENYRLEDLTYVNNELYVADAFAPMVLKVDMETGALEQFIFDLWPTAYYGLASDGQYFYVEDWGTLYKYDMDGEEVGTLDFDETIYGMACDSVHLYTIIEDDDMIRCWDLTEWPQLAEVTQNAIEKPSEACRGLTYDGEYFWTAEAFESYSGKIYRFDREGHIQSEVSSPNYTGWSACFIEDTITTTVPEYATNMIRLYTSAKEHSLFIESDLKQQQELDIGIFDMQARLVKQFSVELDKHQERKRLDKKIAKPGQYIYRIVASDKKVYGGKITIH